MAIRYNNGLGWYIYDLKLRTILASQFENREEAQNWLKERENEN